MYGLSVSTYQAPPALVVLDPPLACLGTLNAHLMFLSDGIDWALSVRDNSSRDPSSATILCLLPSFVQRFSEIATLPRTAH